MESTGFLFIFGAYLLGSISSAILVCRLLGFGDPRESGSGNPGATNVLRIGGKRAALLTLLGDSLKGVLPVLFASLTEQPILVTGLTAVAAFLGHLFPIFFRFQGGKGVATFFGVIWVLNWQLGLYASLCWLICSWAFRISSLSALMTSITVPIYAWFFFNEQFVFFAIIGVMLIIRHQSNIKNILQGTESKLGQKQTE